jgi:RimJ/RimL family protein N-acetyltransferase
LKESGRLIGHVVSHQIEPKEFLTYTLGFVFHPGFHGRGYATEACRRVIQLVFEELGARRIETHCHPDNSPAWRLLERLGLRREGHHLQSGFLRRAPDGTPLWWDSLDYALLKDEWQDRQRG